MIHVEAIKTTFKVFYKHPFTLLYSIYFNLRYFKIQVAMKIPILISPCIKVQYVKRGCIQLRQVYPFMVRIGLWGTDGIAASRGYLNIAGGKVTFKGTAMLGKGFSLKQDTGEIAFGNNFFCNSNCTIYNNQNIHFGDNILIGWNCSLRTSDGHTITYSDGTQNHDKPITIGNHVWIGACTQVCKGVAIADCSVVAQHSLVTKSLLYEGTLYGGAPAKIIKRDIEWQI